MITAELLPEIADRLERIRGELVALPGPLTAALRVRFAKYDCALTALGALPEMLKEVAAGWPKPNPGQPKLWIEAEVVDLLITAVEKFTGEKLPSPRSIKRKDAFKFVHLLSKRLLPDMTDANFRTALAHWHRNRSASNRKSIPANFGPILCT